MIAAKTNKCIGLLGNICLQLQLLLLLIRIHVQCAIDATSSSGSLKVIYAINAGGSEHLDKYGIHYEADPLHVGIASDYGNNLLMIGRVPEHDEVLYRTERYHTATFGYELPVDGDGDYALVMKFCEVYFQEPNRKIFDIVLNKKHTIVSKLDIYREVGHGNAHDEIVNFKIKNDLLEYNTEVSDVRSGRIRLDFIKGNYDNPKINAFALLKGDVTNVPRLPPLNEDFIESEPGNIQGNKQEKQKQQIPKDEEDDIDVDEVEDTDEINDVDESDAIDNENYEVLQQQKQTKHKRKDSGPRQPNPYVVEDSSVLWPIFMAIGAFIPLIYFICKL